jgi:hypothetical protein
MKRKGIFFITILFFNLDISAQKINPARPDLSPSNFKLDSLPVSEINIPIAINLKPVYLMAEKSVDTLFTSPKYPDEWVYEGCATRYKYSFRRSPLQMKASGTSLTLGFTGYYKISGSTRVCAAGLGISPWTPPCNCGSGSEGERKVNVSFTNSISILPDYKVKLNIVRNEPQPLNKCEVCFWGQDITSEVLKGLKTELDAAKKELDKQYSTVNLKSRFQQVWDQLTKVYNINNLGWLKMNPEKIRINSIFAKNDSLNISLGLSAKPVISFEKPAEQPTWIPNLGSFSRTPGFNIFLDAVLSYDSLSAILNKQAAGTEFIFKKFLVKKKFIIDSCKIYGAGNEKLVIKINFSGTNQGVIYLLGKPVYDTATKILGVTDVDFDIKSKNVLLGSADWLFDKKITSQIKKNAQFSLASYIDTAKATINQQLNQEWIKGIRSYGKIADIKLAGIYPMQKNLVIRSNCSGELSVKVESIHFSL